MARIAILEEGRTSLISRALFRAARRRLGRMPESWKVMAHVPRLHLGRGVFELLLDSSRLVPRRLRRLADIKAATLIGCPA
ncbi:MAG TPA: hypothetical protein VI078_00815 [bacterium]